MICPKCRATIVEDSRFVICPKCGAMFDTLDVPAHLKTKPSRNPSSSYKRPSENNIRQTPVNKSVPVKENTNHMNIFVILAIIAGLAFLFIYIISSNSSSCANRGVNDILDDTNYSYYESNNNEGDDREEYYTTTTTSTTSSTKKTESVKKEGKQTYNERINEDRDYNNGNGTGSTSSDYNYQVTSGKSNLNNGISEWLQKDYYTKATVSDAVFGKRYNRAPLTKKPYSVYATIPDSDYICSIYPGEHFYVLGDPQSGAEKVYYNGYIGYLDNVYTLDATYYDKSFSFNAPGVYIAKSNNEYIAYKNGPIPNYSGIAPAGDTYWLISNGKVYYDVYADILVYYKENGSETPVYLQINRGKLVAIKTRNGIVLWSS